MLTALAASAGSFGDAIRGSFATDLATGAVASASATRGPAFAPAKVLDGNRREVPVAEGEAIVDAAIRAGLDLPFACKGGMCATCRARIVEGAAVMDVNYSLELWEVKSGFVLTCQAHPTTPRIVVDYDHV